MGARLRLLVLLGGTLPEVWTMASESNAPCTALQASCAACSCLLGEKCSEENVPENCSSSSTCSTDAMALCPDMLRLRQAICRLQHHVCPCQYVVDHGFFIQQDSNSVSARQCFGSRSCGQVSDDLTTAEIPWGVNVTLQCVNGFKSNLRSTASYSCLPFGNGTVMLRRSDSSHIQFDGLCLEDPDNLGDTWLVRGAAILSLLGGGVVMKLFAAHPEVRRSAVDLDHLFMLSLTLCAVALCSLWGSLSPVDCERQGPATLAATLSTLVLALYLHASIFRNMRIRAGATRRPPHRLLVKLALVIFGWVAPVAVGVIVALTSPEGFYLEHKDSDEPFLCTWSRNQPGTELKRLLLFDGPAIFVFAISALLACQMLLAWCGCAWAVGMSQSAAPDGGDLELSLLDTSVRNGTALKREGALAELEEGARRVADLAGRQLWMLLSFLLCWTPRIVLTLHSMYEDPDAHGQSTLGLNNSKSAPLTVVVARHLHALLWPLQGFFLTLAFKNVQNGGVLQEKGSYEELMARIGYARQEAATDNVNHRLSVDTPGGSQWDKSVIPADVAAIRSSVSAGV